MSEALDYLLKTRKGAMEPYFQFLKEGGKHLDTKTRSLLSVITKVDSQTEAGFKQYLKRALSAGNTADEILDAMLVCIPTLGLSKIIWAINIILSMDLQEFHPDHLGEKSEWKKLGSLDQIQQGNSCVLIENKRYFVFRDSDIVKVYSNKCPHQGTEIPESGLGPDKIICPKHGWEFSPETGECVARGDKGLKQIEIKEEDDTVYVFD